MTAPQLLRKIHSHATKAAEQIAERNAAIVAAHEAGYSYREIAEVAGLHHTAIYKIVKKGKTP